MELTVDRPLPEVGPGGQQRCGSLRLIETGFASPPRGAATRLLLLLAFVHYHDVERHSYPVRQKRVAVLPGRASAYPAALVG